MKSRDSVRHHSFRSKVSTFYGARSGAMARVVLVLLIFSMVLPAPASVVPNRVMAAPGDLVPTFGKGGVVMTDFAGGNDSANAVATNWSGKIIAAGSATIPGQGTNFALACYDRNGNLDPTFGQGGKVTTDFFSANDGARGLVVDRNNNIWLSGFATNGTQRQFAIARYLPNGNLDLTFDQDGKVNLPLGLTSEAFKIVVQGDGKPLIVGDSRQQNNLDFTIVRLNQDGSLDNTFGNNGVVRVDFGFTDRAIDLAINNNKIYVCGIVVKNQTDSDFGLASLNPDGSLNNSFGGDGTVTTDFFGRQDGAQAIINTNVGTVEYWLLAGFATGATPGQPEDLALVRYNSDGSLDTSFDGDGKKTIDFLGGRDLFFDLIEQPDGDYVGTGWAGSGTVFDLGIAKMDRSGNLDSGWGLQGKYTLDTASGGNNVAFDAIICEDTYITAGTGVNPATGNDDFILTQHENEKFAEITKRAPPTPVVRGDIITYTFEITNFTDNELSLVVTDVLPVGVTFEKSQNPDWGILSEFGRSPIIERRLSVSGGQTIIIALRVRADQSGILKNKANLLLPHPNDPIIGYVTPTLLSSSEVESEVKKPDGEEIGFDLCLQDDNNGNVLQLNTRTGEYKFCGKDGLTFSGKGKIEREGSILRLEDDGRVSARLVTFPFHPPSGRGSAKVRQNPLGPTYLIIDRNVTNNNCDCP